MSCRDGPDRHRCPPHLRYRHCRFSHVVDSLSAIKYAKVKCIRNEQGLVTDYEIEGDFPKYGNDDDYADDIMVSVFNEYKDYITGRLPPEAVYIM